MAENQNIEWKESWRDEYLKWICGFANAVGGKIYIGVNDDGKVVGVADCPKLLEDIPNKVRDVLGIIVDVKMLEDGALKYIEIDVPAYPNPITNQERNVRKAYALLPVSRGQERHWSV